MDPPPPPRNLQLGSSENELKTENQDEKSAQPKPALPQQKTSSSSLLGQQAHLDCFNELSSEVKTQTNSMESMGQQQQQPLLLKDMKLVYGSSSSSSSSPVPNTPKLSTQNDQKAVDRKDSKTKVEFVSGQRQQADGNKPVLPKQKKSSAFIDLYDNQIDLEKVRRKFG
jgi:hypothetical protein